MKYIYIYIYIYTHVYVCIYNLILYILIYINFKCNIKYNTTLTLLISIILSASTVFFLQINFEDMKLTTSAHFYLFIYLHLADAFIQSNLPEYNSGYTFFFVSTCVPWESNPQPLRC